MCWTGISDTGKGGRDWGCSALVRPLVLFAALLQKEPFMWSSCAKDVLVQWGEKSKARFLD